MKGSVGWFYKLGKAGTYLYLHASAKVLKAMKNPGPKKNPRLLSTRYLLFSSLSETFFSFFLNFNRN